MDSAMEISPILAKKTGELALKHAKEFEKHSRLPPALKIPQLEWSDLEVGDLLGEGAFSSVYSVKVAQLSNGNTSSTSTSRSPRLLGRRQNKKISSNNPQEYAIKMVRPQIKSNKHYLKVSAVSLVLEAKILEKVQHENIIKLHGVKGGCLSKACGYFLVLQRLYGTLHQKLKKWYTYQEERLLVHIFSKKHNRVPTLVERIQTIALGVASAMKYLHSNNVLYRDLKPQNCGFDKQGKVVLFDFGVAQELDPNGITCNGGKPLTKQVGTFRYMAPESYNSTLYGMPSDVYSYGMLLYAICTLKAPFPGCTANQLKKLVICGNERPSLKRLANYPELVDLIQECCDPTPEARPTFADICTRLNMLSTSSTKCRQ